MAYDDPNLLHLDALLTQVSVGYENEEFVANQLMPSVSVRKQSDRYLVMEKEGFRILDDRRAPKSEANEMPPMTLSRDTYYAEEHALVDLVSPQEQAMADSPVDPLNEAAERTTDTILLNRENTVQTLVRATANYDASHSTTLAGANQWSDYSGTSDPIGDVKAGRDQIHASIVKTPTVGLGGYEVISKLEDHPDFIERIKYSQLGVTTLQLMATLMDIPRVVRAGAQGDTGAPGAALAPTYLWGKDFILAFVPAAPSRRTPAFGYEYTWIFASGGDQLNTVERWWDKDKSSWKVRVQRFYDHKFAAVDSVAGGLSVGGYLIKNAVA